MFAGERETGNLTSQTHFTSIRSKIIDSATHVHEWLCGHFFWSQLFIPPPKKNKSDLNNFLVMSDHFREFFFDTPWTWKKRLDLRVIKKTKVSATFPWILFFFTKKILFQIQMFSLSPKWGLDVLLHYPIATKRQELFTVFSSSTTLQNADV